MKKRYCIMWHGVAKDGRATTGYGRMFHEEEMQRKEYLCMVMERLTNVTHFIAEVEG